MEWSGVVRAMPAVRSACARGCGERAASKHRRRRASERATGERVQEVGVACPSSAPCVMALCDRCVGGQSTCDLCLCVCGVCTFLLRVSVWEEEEGRAEGGGRERSRTFATRTHPRDPKRNSANCKLSTNHDTKQTNRQNTTHSTVGHNKQTGRRTHTRLRSNNARLIVVQTCKHGQSQWRSTVKAQRVAASAPHQRHTPACK